MTVSEALETLLNFAKRGADGSKAEHFRVCSAADTLREVIQCESTERGFRLGITTCIKLLESTYSAEASTGAEYYDGHKAKELMLALITQPAILQALDRES